MEANLKSFEPLMNNGNHDSYIGQHGTMWKFTMEFEDGTKGNAQSPKQQPSWKIGDTYIFDVVENNGYKNIKGMKPKDSNFNNGGGGKKENPLTQQLIIAQSSCDKAIRLFELKVKKEDGSEMTIKDLEPVTDKIMGIINRLAIKHNQ